MFFPSITRLWTYDGMAMEDLDRKQCDQTTRMERTINVLYMGREKKPFIPYKKDLAQFV